MKENPNYVKGSRKEGLNYKYYRPRVSGIYIVYHDVSKHYYIGNTSDVGRRIGHHFGQLRRGVHTTKRFQDLYNKSEYEDFSFKVVEIESKSERDAKELYLLDKNKDDPLLLNTATTNNSWIDDRNNELVNEWREKVSKKAKLRTGTNNPFYGRVHTEETRKKISESNLGKDLSYAYKSIVINGVFYESLQNASDKIGVHITTISHRVRSENPLFCNWYEYNREAGVKVIDERVLCDPKDKPNGLYSVEGKLYLFTADIMKEYGLKVSTMNNRFRSKGFPEWKRLI